MNYKCRKHKEFHCGARLVYKDGVHRISGTHHTHPIEDDEISRISFVNEFCRRAGLQRVPDELKSIFEETRREYVDYFVFKFKLNITISNFLVLQMFPLDIMLP